MLGVRSIIKIIQVTDDQVGRNAGVRNGQNLHIFQKKIQHD